MLSFVFLFYYYFMKFCVFYFYLLFFKIEKCSPTGPPTGSPRLSRVAGSPMGSPRPGRPVGRLPAPEVSRPEACRRFLPRSGSVVGSEKPGKLWKMAKNGVGWQGLAWIWPISGPSGRPDSSESDPTLWKTFHGSPKFNSGA